MGKATLLSLQASCQTGPYPGSWSACPIWSRSWRHPGDRRSSRSTLPVEPGDSPLRETGTGTQGTNWEDLQKNNRAQLSRIHRQWLIGARNTKACAVFHTLTIWPVNQLYVCRYHHLCLIRFVLDNRFNDSYLKKSIWIMIKSNLIAKCKHLRFFLMIVCYIRQGRELVSKISTVKEEPFMSR